MQRSDQPYIELKKAIAAIQAMREAQTLDEFEEQWKEYLGRLERVWNKSSNHFGRSPKWSGWKGRYEGLRKTDALLSYLVNARGADEHSVNEITEREGQSMTINAAFGNSLHIESMTNINGRLAIRSSQPFRISFLPTRTKLLPITNRGRLYAIPTQHQGKAVDPADVLALAELGAGFYSEFLDSAEAFFIK
jgi:hypothetical protein